MTGIVILVNALALLGAASLAVGAFLIWVPLGFLVVGVLLIAAAFMLSREDPGANTGRTSS